MPIYVGNRERSGRNDGSGLERNGRKEWFG